MIAATLPQFKYHPDPVATGAVIESSESCACCSRNRGYVYAGPVYSSHNIKGLICPWCIADGSASEKYEASFCDDHTLSDLSESTIKEVTQRTPGFSAWQQERWLTCCNDACSFIAAEYNHKLPYGDDFWDEVKGDLGFNDEEWVGYKTRIISGFSSLYVFKCLHCNKLHGLTFLQFCVVEV